MTKNLIEKTLLENIKKKNKKLSSDDLNLLTSCRFSLSVEDFKEIFSNIEYIKLIDLSYKDGCFLETALLFSCKNKKLNIIDTFDFFFSQIEKANYLQTISTFSLNNILLNSCNYNQLDVAKYLLHSDKLPFKADISFSDFGCLFNAYYLYKKGKTETFIYLNEQYDYLNDKEFIKCAKRNFRKRPSELDELFKIMSVFQNIKDLKTELDNNFSSQPIKVMKKNKI